MSALPPFSVEALRVHCARQQTPLFVYASALVGERIALLREQLGPEVELLYAHKANPHPGVVRALLPLVEGVDVSSEAELRAALAAGFQPQRISLTGPAKSLPTLVLATELGLGAVCVESVEELAELHELAGAQGVRVPVRLRVNPPEPILAYAIVIGGRPSPFGIDFEQLGSAAAFLRAHSQTLQYLGTHFFSGAQCLSARALSRHLAQALELSRKIERTHGLLARSINLGGGFGIPFWSHQRELDLGALAGRARVLFAEHQAAVGHPVRFVFELGRYIVGPAGVFISSVRRVKESRGRRFVLLDGGINCFLTGAGLWSGGKGHFHVLNLDHPEGPRSPVDLCGPLCTPADSLGVAVELAQPHPGDRLAFFNAGAYGPSASLGAFISHPRPQELMV